MRLSKTASVLKQKCTVEESLNVCGNFHADVENEESKSSARQKVRNTNKTDNLHFARIILLFELIVI